jgi:flavin reductase (NADH)
MPKTALAADFKHAMRRLAAGVTIVTTAGGDGRAGLTATAVCSLSADPARLLVCVNRDAAPNAAIAASGRFCVNVLALRHRALALRFAGATGVAGDDRFARGKWGKAATGAPVLLDALASFDCAVWARTGGAPLLYAAGAFHRLTKHKP